MYDYLFYKFYARGNSQEYVLDKQKSIAAYKGYMINRLQKMFYYENLPETIPQYMLEYYLLVNGSCLIAEYNGKPYAFLGSFGGEPDPYYRPTKYVVANPALKMNETFSLWDTDAEQSKKCVLMRNDVMWMGLNPLMSRYATLLAENVITLRTADIMLRVVAMLSSPDDKTKIAAEQYLRNLEDGKLGVIGENRFFEGVKLQSPPSNNGSYLTQFIELQQYYKGSFFNEIGLSASFNMKREAIGEGEATLNEDTLAPLIDTMMQCRQEDVSRLNDLFDLSISVEFDSAWRQNIEETKLNLKILESTTESNDGVSQLTNNDEVDLNAESRGNYVKNSKKGDGRETTEEFRKSSNSNHTPSESPEGNTTGDSSSNSSESGYQGVNEDSNSANSGEVSQLTTININLQSVDSNAESELDDSNNNLDLQIVNMNAESEPSVNQRSTLEDSDLISEESEGEDELGDKKVRKSDED